MARVIIGFVFFAMLAFGQQDGMTVSNTEGPPARAFINLLFYTGTNLTSQCIAPQRVARTSVSIGASFSNIVVSSNTGTVNWTAHGLYVGARVTVSGATVDAQLNDTYKVQTVVNADSFTITTGSVSDATYSESTLTIVTNYPRTSATVWAIKALTYDGSDNLTSTYWANGQTNTGVGGLACSGRAGY